MTDAVGMAWFTPEIEAVQAWHREQVAALFAGRDPGGVVAVAGPMFGSDHGLWGTNAVDMLAEPERWLDETLADMARKRDALADRRVFAPALLDLDPLGTHYVDALFGATVHFHEGQVWGEELACDPADLAPPDLARNAVFTASLELARRAVARSGGRLLISFPVLSCPINIGLNLFGQRLLEALHERPAAARHALRTITDVIVACAQTFQALIPRSLLRCPVGTSRCAPPGHGYIDGCAAQLVSAAHYREFFAPLDAEILAAWPEGGMIHLCGACVQHIPAWREMQALRSVQLNDRATDDLEHYLAGLRRDQVLYVSPTATFPPARVLELCRGRPLVLQCPPP